jgi:hypothetical protein
MPKGAVVLHPKVNQLPQNRESIVKLVMAGLLTCNIFTALPIRQSEQWATWVKTA